MNPFFIGCERKDMIQTGVIGSIAKHNLLREIKDYYKDKSFIKANGTLDLLPNPQVITPIISREYDWIPKNIIQRLDDGVSVYPIDYFCAKEWKSGKISTTKNTYTIHHFSGTWHTKSDKLKMIIINIIGAKATQYIVRLKSKFSNLN